MGHSLVYKKMTKRKRSYKSTGGRPSKRRRILRARRRLSRRGPSFVSKNPFPNRKLVKLEYIDHISMDPPATAIPSVYRFRCNSIYDPDRTGSGHQPRAHDQLALMYQKYHVIGSKIEIQLGSGAVPTSVGLVFGIATRESTQAVETSIVEYIEQGNCNYRVVNLSGGGTAPKFISKWKPKMTFPVTNVLDEGNLGAAFGANPAKMADWHVFALGADSGDHPAIKLIVRISYLVVLTEPADLDAS